MFDPANSPPEPKRNEPALKAPPVTLALVLILVAMTALLHLVPDDLLLSIIQLGAFHPGDFFSYLRGDGGEPLAVVGLVGHAFLHFDWFHLATNAGFLLAFGSVVERRLGALHFLICFLLSALAGALTQGLFSQADSLIGASGGLYGVMALALLCSLRSAPQQVNFILVLVALNLGIGLLSEADLTGGFRIGWQAHMGGLIAGLLYGFVVKPLRRPH